MSLKGVFESLNEMAAKNRQNQPSLDLPSQVRFNILSVLLFLIPAGLGILLSMKIDNPLLAIAGIIIGATLAQSPKVAKQWERAVLLRFGKYIGLRGPGIFWIIPFMDSVSDWIDQRVM